jgi:hypothetical protein
VAPAPSPEARVEYVNPFVDLVDEISRRFMAGQIAGESEGY